MKQVTLLDTAISSDNLGDEIIMDAVRDELFAHLTESYFYTVATHVGLSRRSRKILRETELAIVGGTNFISSNLLRNSGWKVSAFDLPWLHDVVMMGVGWRDYQDAPTAYSAFVYRRALSSTFLHSCRDEYSAKRLRSLGLKVVNTSCPTMWRLTPDFCRRVPVEKAPAAVVALTYYRSHVEHDTAFLAAMRQHYGRLLFWTQQAEDRDYVASLGDFGLEMIPPNVAAYNHVLETEDVDFVGSRLHGGIRALQHGRRTLILSVDNRATEIGRDTGLPVVERSNIAGVVDWIGGRTATEIRLPTAAIEAFLQQFVGF